MVTLVKSKQYLNNKKVIQKNEIKLCLSENVSTVHKQRLCRIKMFKSLHLNLKLGQLERAISISSTLINRQDWQNQNSNKNLHKQSVKTEYAKSRKHFQLEKLESTNFSNLKWQTVCGILETQINICKEKNMTK